MKLDLRFSERPLEELWCQAVVALVFQEPDVESGAITGLNGKMAGFLTSLEERGFLTGAGGEAILLAGQSMVMAEKILLRGLGKSSDYGVKCLVDVVREVGLSLDRLKVNEFGIHIPILEGLEAEYPSHLELSARQLVESFLENHEGESSFFLKVIFSLEKRFGGVLKPMVNRLRDHLSSFCELSIIIDRETEKTA